MKGETCTCTTCGYQWLWGTDGGHSCAEQLQKENKKLHADLAEAYHAIRYWSGKLRPEDPRIVLTEVVNSKAEAYRP